MIKQIVIYLPLVFLYVLYLIFIIHDLKQKRVRYLPKWAWLLLSAVSLPLGGLLYIFIGRQEGEVDESLD